MPFFGRGGAENAPPNGVGLTINKYNYLFQIEKFRLGVRSYLDPFVDPMVNPLKRLFQGDNQEKVSKVCFLFSWHQWGYSSCLFNKSLLKKIYTDF